MPISFQKRTWGVLKGLSKVNNIGRKEKSGIGMKIKKPNVSVLQFLLPILQALLYTQPFFVGVGKEQGLGGVFYLFNLFMYLCKQG